MIPNLIQPLASPRQNLSSPASHTPGIHKRFPSARISNATSSGRSALGTARMQMPRPENASIHTVYISEAAPKNPGYMQRPAVAEHLGGQRLSLGRLLARAGRLSAPDESQAALGRACIFNAPKESVSSGARARAPPGGSDLNFRSAPSRKRMYGPIYPPAALDLTAPAPPPGLPVSFFFAGRACRQRLGARTCSSGPPGTPRTPAAGGI